MIVCIFNPLEQNIVYNYQNGGIQIVPLLRSDNNIKEIKDLNPDVLICRNRDNISQFLKDCPNIKLLFILEVGLEKLPFQDLIIHNVRVANTSGISADIMSNYAMACILNHAVYLEEDIDNKHKHQWKKYQCTSSLAERCLLIVGAGRTGTAIAQKAKVFGLKTIGVVKHKKENKFFDIIGTIEDLDSYLAISDYVVCTIPLTSETHYMFYKRRFNIMKPSSVFINISRGAIVNETDLLEAVEVGRIAKAYLDVFEIEPLPTDHAFWDNPNIVITPHQAGRLDDYIDKAIDMFVNNYKAYINGEIMPNEVDLSRGY
jgi:phosphoglycerate dehydrogenase-like enzyme